MNPCPKNCPKYNHLSKSKYYPKPLDNIPNPVTCQTVEQHCPYQLELLLAKQGLGYLFTKLTFTIKAYNEVRLDKKEVLLILASIFAGVALLATLFSSMKIINTELFVLYIASVCVVLVVAIGSET
jgi:hypothetical protein